MMTTIKSVVDDLAPFADLGTKAPIVATTNDRQIVRFIRNGLEFEITYTSEYTIERCEGVEQRHAGIKALLASSKFADLGRWATSQSTFLEQRVKNENIRLIGSLSDTTKEGGVEVLEQALVDMRAQQSNIGVAIALIDGPAGIGKTSVIRSLAYLRAHQFRLKQEPLILHVESRGRILQNITDLMAFSLQTLRVGVTYDQIPVLVRQGLITLAIDGFDELGDPNGYELAWAQVNDLVKDSRGQGTIILSGRETFLSASRLKVALNAFDDRSDRLICYTLGDIKPSIAKAWLSDRGWTEEQLDSDAAKPLFDVNSYALRPFFLSELARDAVAKQIVNGSIEDLLSFLIETMISREAGKFGRDVEVASTQADRELFIRRLMEETARDLAENQTDAVSGDSLVWISEIVADGLIPSTLIGMFKNRAGVIAFLTEDDRRGYKRFVHEQVSNYFLSYATVNSLLNNEIPKFVRRNIFGTEFLSNFADVFRYQDRSTSDLLCKQIEREITRSGNLDRSRRNLGALLLVCCSVNPPSKPVTISDISFEEVLLLETPSNIALERVTIAQLHARGADFREVLFDQSCYVISLIGDNGTVPPVNIPAPSVIATPGETLSASREITAWLRTQQESVVARKSVELASLKNFGLFELLYRVARYKPFWLRDSDQKSGRRILDDPNWASLKVALSSHDILVERKNVPASGRPGTFFHIRNREQLLSFQTLPKALFIDLVQASLDLLASDLESKLKKNVETDH